MIKHIHIHYPYKLRYPGKLHYPSKVRYPDKLHYPTQEEALKFYRYEEIT
jgi:hypothetical protein